MVKENKDLQQKNARDKSNEDEDIALERVQPDSAHEGLRGAVLNADTAAAPAKAASMSSFFAFNSEAAAHVGEEESTGAHVEEAGQNHATNSGNGSEPPVGANGGVSQEEAGQTPNLNQAQTQIVPPQEAAAPTVKVDSEGEEPGQIATSTSDARGGAESLAEPAAIDRAAPEQPVSQTSDQPVSQVSDQPVDGRVEPSLAPEESSVPAEANSDISQVIDADGDANIVDENAAIGSSVGLVASAVDANSSDSVTYSLSDDASGLFAIDPVSGEVTVAGSLDREVAASHDIEVTATSTDGSISTQSYTIALNDVDEFDVSPVTDTDAGANTLTEAVLGGTAVGIVASASDADATNSAVSYSVDDSRFTVDADGTVRVATGASFDFETEASIDIAVTATSEDGSTSTQSFTLGVTDINEAGVSAISDADGLANTIAENSVVGSSVGITAFAIDADGTDSVTYSLSDDAGGLFAIDANTGEVTVAGSLDREVAASYDIEVTATSTDGSTSTQSYTIALNDVDEFDVSPVTDTDAGADTLTEAALGGTAVGIVASASDADATNSNVTYSVDDARFTVDADGTVRVATGASFDFETEASIDIAVTATSEDGSTSTQSFSLGVADINEASVSAVSDTDGSANAVDENSAIGTSVGITAFASDSDGTDSVTYSLSDDAGGLFEIDSRTGEVTVAGRIDRETDTSFNIEVTATSSDGSTSTQTFEINVNDVDEFDVTAIVDTDGSANAVDENSAIGTSVGITAFASDSDGTDSVTYSLSDDAGGLFEIDSRTGEVTVAGRIDRETDTSFNIEVTATSSDGSTSTQTFEINVNDVDEFDVTAIVDTDGSANAVDENSAIGTSVGITVSASDADGTDSVTYSLSDDAGGLFAIDPVTGEVTVAGALDREVADGYGIEVKATSTDGSTSTQSYKIAINDVDEFDVTTPVDTDLNANAISEDASVGYTTGMVVSAQDGDATDSSVTYSVDDGRFIVGADGTVLVAYGASFDHETEPSIDIAVTATSADGSTSSQTFTLNVTDTNEVSVSAISDADGSANAVDENSAIGTSVGITASASDADGTDSVTYSLSDDAGGLFAIDPVSGEVTVAGSLDREAAASYDIEVTATSTDGSTSTETYTININDLNDNAPTDIGVAGGSVVENAAGGTVVATLSAVDADITDSHSYTITSDPSGLFEVVGNEVRVRDGADIDYETATSHEIVVEVEDAAGHTYAETLTFSVDNIDGVNLEGTDNVDSLIGTSEDDTILGKNDDDTLVGGGGNDTFLVVGNDGTDTIDGGAGYDTIQGSGYSDTIGVNSDLSNLSGIEAIDGGAGGYDTILATDGDDNLDFSDYQITNIDRIDAGAGDDTVIGTSGDDNIRGDAGNDTLSGGAGDDNFLVSGSGHGLDSIDGGEGYDTVLGGTYSDTIRVNSDMSNLTDVEAIDGGGGWNTIQATTGDDNLDFSNLDLSNIDEIRTEAGNDTVIGSDSDDSIITGSGDDVASGGLGDDYIRGGDGNDTLSGGEGDDTLEGSAGNDTLSGGAGNDTFNVIGDDGTDTIDGGEGVDTIQGSQYGDTIRVTSNFSNLTDIEAIDGGDGYDSITATSGDDVLDLTTAPTITNIERINAGAGDDTVIGTTGDDTIEGGSGNDNLTGGQGNDTFLVSGDDGTDVIDGGDGYDTVQGGAYQDTIRVNSDMSNLSNIEAIDGGDGNDRIRATSGDDNLDFSSYDLNSIESIQAGDGNDTITGSSSDDVIDGGTGTDTYVLSGNRSDYTITESDGNYTIVDNRTGSPEGTDTVLNVETFSFADGDVAAADLIESVSAISDADGSANAVDENSAIGTSVGITASASDVDAGDSVTYSLSDDAGGLFAIDANTGEVTVAGSLDRETAASYDIEVTATSTDGSTSTQSYTVDVTNVIDETPTDITFTGGSVNETVASGGDIASAYDPSGSTVAVLSTTDADGADDSFTYTITNDPSGHFEIVGDEVRVKSGQTIDFETASSHAVEIQVEDSAGNTFTKVINIDVDDFEGSSTGSSATGTSEEDTLTGSAGNDTLVGRAGADQLSGGEGNDSLYVDGDDTLIDGGDGYDTLHVESGSSGINLDVNAASIENVYGGEGDDTFDATGATDAVTLRGDEGDDALTGGDGNDLLVGGAGADQLSGGEGNDSLYVDGDDTLIDGGDGYDTLHVESGSSGINLDVNAASIENVYGGEGDDTFDATGATDAVVLRGDEGNDTLTGGDGNDLLVGGAGADQLSGGAGNDSLYVDANDTLVSGGDGYDTLHVESGSSGINLDVNAASIENVYGGEGDDTFDATGATDAVTLRGDEGNDTLTGGDGNDLLVGGTGADQLTGGAGNDVHYGGDGSDTVVFSGDRADYTVTEVSGGYRVEDNRSGTTDGIDTVYDVESFQFADGTVAVGDLIENVSAISDTDSAAEAVSEGASIGASVGITASASDVDAGDSVTYSLSDDAGGLFAIDPVSGEVTVVGSLDREVAASHDIEVTATSTDGSTSTQSYTIALNDVDEFDVSTVTDTDAGANTLTETAAAGTAVGVVASASDADATNSAVSYSVDDARFTVDADGTVRVASGASFDFETEASIDIAVTATSEDGSTSTQSFTLGVTDINEAPTDLTFAGNDSLQAGGSGSALDLDGTGVGLTVGSGLSVDNQQWFSVEMKVSFDTIETSGWGGDLFAQSNAWNQNGGYLSIYDGKVGYHQYNSGVWEGGTETAVGDIVEGQEYMISFVKEGSNVRIYLDGELVASDTAASSMVDSTAALQFLNGVDGQVSEIRVWDNSLTQGEIQANLDADLSSSTSTDLMALYTFEDGAGTTVTDVSGNGHDMTFDSAQADWLAGNTLEAGSVVGSVASVIDVDTGDTHTYALTDDAAGKFTIDPNTGEISLVGDHDTSSAYSDTVTVQVTDSGGQTYSEVVGINLGTEDNNSLVGSDSTDIMYGFGDAATTPAETNNIAVDNASFQSYSTHNGEQVFGAPANWDGSGTVGLLNPTSSELSDVGYGGNVGFVDDNSAMSQTLADTFDSNASYDIALQVGTLNGDTPGAFEVNLYAGGQLIGTHSGSTSGTGSMSTVSFTVEGDGFDAYDGQALTVEVSKPSSDGSKIVFDEIAITENVPEIAGGDNISAGGGDDIVVAGAGDDTVSAGTGDDTVFMGDGDDTFDTTESNTDDNDGNDTVDGGAGNDQIWGGGGNDMITGGTGDDMLSGELGDDTFIYEAGDGSDTVYGGAGGGWTDTIDLQGMDGAVTVDGTSVSGNGWTMQLDSGSVLIQDGESLSLSDDSAGTITFDDGAIMTFTEIEQINW